MSGHPELEVLVGADLGQRTQLEPVVLGRQFKLQVFGGFGGFRNPKRTKGSKSRLFLAMWKAYNSMYS